MKAIIENRKPYIIDGEEEQELINMICRNTKYTEKDMDDVTIEANTKGNQIELEIRISDSERRDECYDYFITLATAKFNKTNNPISISDIAMNLQLSLDKENNPEKL